MGLKAHLLWIEGLTILAISFKRPKGMPSLLNIGALIIWAMVGHLS
jgi:hypothetical protein